MRRTLLALTAAAALVAPAAASAHIQVRPAEVAPGDPVLWTVIAPSEQEAGVRQVELQVPEGVLPFSYEDAPGWKRTVKTASDGTPESIVWRGSTAGDGMATFRFLASAPEEEGTIAWKALQTYKDGEIARWIGDEGTDSPASFTTVSADAPRENAGGEGAAKAAASDDRGGTLASPNLAEVGGEDEHTDWFARGLAIAALVVAFAGLALLSRRRPSV